jgi:RHS repeat-associated protein
VTATDPSGNSTTNTYEVTSSGPSKTFTYDANGNLTGDGTRTFEWDARNQLVAVNAGTYRSEFTYDGQQRRVRLVEKDNGVVQSDTKVIWCDEQICEERGADGTTVMRQAFGLGEQVAGSARLFAADHLGSVAEVADASATLLSRYAYDPWGRRTLTVGTDVTSVGYARYRWHSSGSVSLTLHRAYDAESARWLAPDPLHEVRAVRGLSLPSGTLYTYVSNRPLMQIDPSGLAGVAALPLVVPAVSQLACLLTEAGAAIGLGILIGALTGSGSCNECEDKKKRDDGWLRRDPECWAQYYKDSAWCGSTFTQDVMYDKCMDWAWGNLLRCKNGAPWLPFNPFGRR